MKRKPLTFVCAECEEVKPLRSLSESSLELAGTNDKEAALVILRPEDQVCRACDVTVEDLDGLYAGEYAARNDVEAFEFSGLFIDAGWLTAYRQSY